MREQNDKLTLQETEQLCRLYMDCRLSVFEEAELRYFLIQVDYHSTIIDEVRRMMDIGDYLSDKPSLKTGDYKGRLFNKWRIPIGIAASIAIIFSCGLIAFHNSSKGQISEEPSYIAYVNGQRLNDEDAKLQIEADKRYVDNFINEISELEYREIQMIDNFSTANS